MEVVVEEEVVAAAETQSPLSAMKTEIETKNENVCSDWEICARCASYSRSLSPNFPHCRGAATARDSGGGRETVVAVAGGGMNA